MKNFLMAEALWYIENCMANRASERVLKRTGMDYDRLSWRIAFSGQFHTVDGSDKFLCCMGDSNVIMLSFGDLPCKVKTEGFIPVANELRSIKQGVSKVSGTSFLHMRVRGSHLSRLICRGGETGISKDLIRVIETTEVPDLSKDHGSHTVINSWNGHDRRLRFIHDLFDGRFDLIDFFRENVDHADGMP